MAEDDEKEPKPPVGTNVVEGDGMRALNPPESSEEPQKEEPQQVGEPVAEAPAEEKQRTAEKPGPAQELSAEDFSDLPGTNVEGVKTEHEELPEPPQHVEPEAQEEQAPPQEQLPEANAELAQPVVEQEQVQPPEQAAEPAQQPVEPASQPEQQVEQPAPTEPEQEAKPAAPVQEPPTEAEPKSTEPVQESDGMTEVKPPEDLKELQESDKEAQELISDEKKGFDESKPRYMQFHSRPRERSFPGSPDQAKKDVTPVENKPAPRQLSKDEQVQRAIELHQQKNAKPGFFSKLLEPIKKKLGFN